MFAVESSADKTQVYSTLSISCWPAQVHPAIIWASRCELIQESLPKPVSLYYQVRRQPSQQVSVAPTIPWFIRRVIHNGLGELVDLFHRTVSVEKRKDGSHRSDSEH